MGTTQERLTNLDIVKGFAIFGVLLTHFLFQPILNTSTTATGISAIPTTLLYMILMAFLVVSGYFYRPRGFAYNVRNRVPRLAIVMTLCILVLPLYMYAYLSALGYSMDFVSGYIDCLRSLIGNYMVLEPMGPEYPYPGLFYTCVGYYFVNLMMVSAIVFFAIADRALRDTKTTAATMLILILLSAVIIEVTPIHLPFQIELVPLSVAFMLFGAVLARMKFAEIVQEGGLKNSRLWVGLALSLAFAFIIVLVFPTGRGFHYAYLGVYGGWSAFPYFLAGCAISIFTILLCTVFSKIPLLSTYLIFTGKHTLAILLLHFTIGKTVAHLLSSEIGINNIPVLNPVVAVLLIFFTSVVASYAGILGTKIMNGRGRKQAIEEE